MCPESAWNKTNSIFLFLFCNRHKCLFFTNVSYPNCISLFSSVVLLFYFPYFFLFLAIFTILPSFMRDTWSSNLCHLGCMQYSISDGDYFTLLFYFLISNVDLYALIRNFLSIVIAFQGLIAFYLPLFLFRPCS